MTKSKTSTAPPPLEHNVRVKRRAATSAVVLLGVFGVSWMLFIDRTGSWTANDDNATLSSIDAPTQDESAVADVADELEPSGGRLVVSVDGESQSSGTEATTGDDAPDQPTDDPSGDDTSLTDALDGFAVADPSGNADDPAGENATADRGDDGNDSSDDPTDTDNTTDDSTPGRGDSTPTSGGNQAGGGQTAGSQPANNSGGGGDPNDPSDDGSNNTGTGSAAGTGTSTGDSGGGESPTETTTPAEQPESTTTTEPSPEPPAGGNPPGDLAGRLFTGWCPAGAFSTSAGGPTTTVSSGGSIQSAINEAASNGGGIVQISGRHTISRPIELRSGVVLRGSGGAVITTSQNMDNMVQFGGGFGGSSTATVTGGNAFGRSFTFSGSLSSGYYIIGDSSRGQLVKVTSINGNTANLELPLAENFTGLSVSPQRDLLTGAGLESLTLEPKHRVRDLIEMRSTRHSWVRNVTTNGVGGQTKAAVYLRQAYRVSVIDNTFSNAAEHGDGGEGYGINIANNSSSSLIANNKLRLFRHSILLQGAAAGNVVRSNDSDEPRHPNFVQGGPADISFHNYASANLVFANTVTRIQINDAGRPGPHNAMLFNTLRTGPLTLDYGANNLTLVGNKMNGSVEDLRRRIMPSLNTDSTAGNPSPERAFWTLDYDPFAGPGGDNRTRLGRGILDWGSGDNVYVDASADYFNPCG